MDSPGTQLLKRAAVARLPAATPRAVAWHFEAIDFELHKPADMAAKLAAQGLDPSRRTLVLMEGLVPYLTPVAADETVRAARTLGAPGSRLVMDEVPPALLRRWFINPLGIFTFLAFRLVAGERFRICGWPDAEVGPYLAARGWSRLLARSPLGETAPAAALPRSLRSGMGACARLVVAEAQ